METPERDSRRAGRTILAWLLLAAGLAAAYAYNFAEMWKRWFPSWRRSDVGLYERVVEGESYYTHAPLVPLVSFVIVALVLRHTSVPVRPKRALGWLVLAAGLGLHLLGSLARVNFFSAASLVGVLAGLVLLLWGARALARLWFPIAFLLFMVPLPELTIAQLNFRLKMSAADWGVQLANLAGVVAERSGNQVFLTGGKHFVIANVCNGLRTLISLLAFGALYAYVCKMRGLWRIGLFAMSVPVAVASNALRIVGLIVVADVWDVRTATGAFHDLSGLMIYVVAFALMFALERLVLGARRLVGRPAEVRPLFADVRRGPADEDQGGRLAHAVGRPAGWAAGAAIVLVAAGATWLNRAVPSPWREETVRETLPAQLTLAGRTYHGYDHVLDDRTLAILEWPGYLCRQYVAAGAPPLELAAIFSRDNRKGTHPPDLCLEGGGHDIVAKADVVVRGVEGHGDVPCHELIIQGGGSANYHIYTYYCAGGYTRSFWRQQLTIFVGGILSRNAGGALLRVSTPVAGDLNAARERAMRLLGAAAPYLDRALTGKEKEP